MYQKIVTVVTLAVLSVAGYIGVQLVQSQQRADQYRDQLERVNSDFSKLKDVYNEAVKRTAVTELDVKDGKLTVVIRTAEGDLQRIATPFDPNREIYVDYVLLNGRLWIRRVFDDLTAPQDAVVINPLLKDINWEAEHVKHGKAVYRKLSTGRWIVTVSGDGSLGLAKAEGQPPAPLEPPPGVRDFEPLTR